MGNGSRLKPDSQGDVLTEECLENLVMQTQASFGAPNQIFMAPQSMSALLNFFRVPGHEIYPEYLPTPWARVARLTKREKKVASLHTILAKLNVFRNLSEDNLDEIKNQSIRRLKRAKWARYQK